MGSRWAIRIGLLLALAACATGCVRRRLTVRSNPPGAVVYVDNQQIGTTPCSVDFTYYGTREIRLVKPGYETLAVTQPIPTPWYQYPGIDFISENLTPYKIRDNRTVSYDLAPQRMAAPDEIIARGEQLRQQLQTSVAPATFAAPIGPPGTTITNPSSIAPPAPTISPLSLPPVSDGVPMPAIPR
jgi:hypothetical protein